jgi:hypothetical protein
MKKNGVFIGAENGKGKEIDLKIYVRHAQLNGLIFAVSRSSY